MKKSDTSTISSLSKIEEEFLFGEGVFDRLPKKVEDLDTDWDEDPSEAPDEFENERFDAIRVIMGAIAGLSPKMMVKIENYLKTAPMSAIVKLMNQYYGGRCGDMRRDLLNMQESLLTEAPKKRAMPDLSDEAEEEFGDDMGDEELDTDGGEMPDEFLFESKMIFLSNLKDIPPAVGDRCITIGLHYTKDQALDLIEHKLDSLCPEYPELSLAMKKKIVNFMRKHQSQAKRFSFRSFLHIATIYMSGDPNWEQWALIQMKSLPT